MHSNASLFPSVNEKERKKKTNPIKAFAETRHLLSLEKEKKANEKKTPHDVI